MHLNHLLLKMKIKTPSKSDEFSTKSESLSTKSVSTPEEPASVADEGKFDQMLSSFSLGESNSVEIVFSFDTTGSMSACLAQVRAKVSETVSRLMKDIPSIRIGIIAHGDFCDGKNAISVLDLSDDVKRICNFVNTVASTSGGDAPEAYELVLRDSKSLSWSEKASKALVMIGDEVPHPPSYTTSKINWFDELDALSDMGVKIYGVRALNSVHSAPFYEELSEDLVLCLSISIALS